MTDPKEGICCKCGKAVDFPNRLCQRCFRKAFGKERKREIEREKGVKG